MKKIFLSLLLVVALMGQASFAAMINNSDSLMASPDLFGDDEFRSLFDDVDSSTYYGNSIFWMYENGVINGYENGSFGPDTCVNRAEFLKMLYETLELSVDDALAADFSDIDQSAWYAPYVNLAKEKGTISGYEDGTFRPGQCVNRVEAIKIVLEEFDMDSGELYSYYASYNDLDLNAWYGTYVENALSMGIVPTDHFLDYNNFNPGENLTRKETAELLYRLKVMSDNELSYYYSWYKPFDIGAVPFYEACEFDVDQYSGDVDLEDLLVDGADFIAMLDYANSNRDDFNKFVSNVSEFDDFENLMMELSDELDVENLWEEIGDFSVAIVADNVDTGNEEFYIIGELEGNEYFEKMMETKMWQTYKTEITCNMEGKALKWTSVDDDMYFWIYGDIFALTSTENARDMLNEMAFEGADSFDVEDPFDDDFFYVYVDDDLVREFAGELSDEFLMYYAYVYDILDFNFGLDFSSNEASLYSEAEILEGSEYYDAYKNYELSLYEKVPARGMTLYYEGPDFSALFDEYASDLYGEVTDYYSDYDMYGAALDVMAEEFEVSSEEILEMATSSFAISVSYVDDVMPGAALYLDIEDEYEDLAEEMIDEFVFSIRDEIVSDIDWYLDVETDLYLTEESGAYDGLKRMTFDFRKLGEQDYFGYENLVFDFYYGVNSDGILVFAMYPDFHQYYGEDTLAEDLRFKSVKSEVYSTFGAEVIYVDFDNLSKIVEDVYEYFVSGEDSEYDEMVYENIMDVLDEFDYFVMSSKMVGNLLKSNALLKLE